MNPGDALSKLTESAPEGVNSQEKEEGKNVTPTVEGHSLVKAERSHDSKLDTPFVGLINQGMTCYMNSILQALYHIPCFRKAVYCIPTKENDMVLALQRLFYNLHHSETSVSTNELTKSLGLENKDLLVQHDVHEFTMTFCERLEDQLKGTDSEGTLKRLFQGNLDTTIDCIKVDKESTKTDSFSDLQLDVKDCRDVYASFDKYVEVERLEGDNKYLSEEFGYQDARKSVLFRDFPPVLQLQLKRFEFDSSTKLMTKINDRYEFPLELDLDKEGGKYLSPHADKSVRNLYTLHSVLVHSGSGYGGHYHAYIRPTLSEQWYNFNDEMITKVDSKRALEEQYGGKLAQTNPHCNNAPFEKTQNFNAYMLVYVRKSAKEDIFCDLDEKDIPEHLRVPPLNVHVSKSKSVHTEQPVQGNTQLSPENKNTRKRTNLGPTNKNTRKRKKFTNTDVTPLSVDDNTPPPLSDMPINCVYNPTDADIITILESKICNLKVVGDMVRKVNVYKCRPYELVRRLYPYYVNCIPHYLAFTKTKLMGEEKSQRTYLGGGFLKIRRRRNVGEGPMGYWTPHGEREMITDEQKNLIGSCIHFSYHEGHLMEREKGRQRSIWLMTEYRIEGKVKAKRTKEQLRYTICKLHKDYRSSHARAFQKSEQEKAMCMELKNDFYNLKRRQGLDYMTDEDDVMEKEDATKGDVMEEEHSAKAEDLMKDLMEVEITKCHSRSLIPSEYEKQLYDDIPLFHKEVGSFQVSKKRSKYRKENKGPTPTTPPEGYSTKYDEKGYEDDTTDAKIKKEGEFSDETWEKWKKLKYMEKDENKWAGSAEDFVRKEEAQAFYSTIMYRRSNADKTFMAMLLKIDCTGLLSSSHINTWGYYFMKHYRQSQIQNGKEARWTILPDDFDTYLDSFKVREPVGPANHRVSYIDDPLWPKLWDVDYIYIPLNRVKHWVLVALCLKDFSVTIYNSIPGHATSMIEERITKQWANYLHKYLNWIDYWKNAKQISPSTLRITVIEDGSIKQENGVDCGVMVCRTLEKVLRGQSLLEEGKTGLKIATDYRKFMADIIYSYRAQRM